MIQVLPFVGSIPVYDFTTTLGSASYTFTVLWNYRENSWYFNVDDADGNNLISSVKLVLGALLGRTVPHSPFTDGVLVAIDTQRDANGGNSRAAGFDDLGSRVVVKYIDVQTLIALRQDSAAALLGV